MPQHLDWEKMMRKEEYLKLEMNKINPSRRDSKDDGYG